MTLQQPDPNPFDSETARPRHAPALAGADWGLVALGAALSAFGIYYTIVNHSKLIGPAMIAGGLTLIPVRIISLVGGAGLVAVGAGELVRMRGPSVVGVLVVVLGLFSILDGVRRGKA